MVKNRINLNPKCLSFRNKIDKEEIMDLELDDLYQLHEAATKGIIGNFQYYMIEFPEDPNPRDNLGLTPLHYAALNGHKEMCTFILDLPNIAY